MKKLSLATMLLLMSNISYAVEAGQALAQKNGCLACHSVDRKVLGPAYIDVKAKYKGIEGSEEKLIQKIKKGGSGVWGPIPMPANSPQISDEDIKIIVQWILK